MMGGLHAHLPTPAQSVQQFLTKKSMTPKPHPPYSPYLTRSNFFSFPGWKKSSKGNILLMWKRWNKQTNKMVETLKGVKINKFRNCSEQWKKRVKRYIAANGEYFESDWNLNVRISTQFFINKFHFEGVPPHTKPSPVINSYSLEKHSELGTWNLTDLCWNHASSTLPGVTGIVNRESLGHGSCLSGVGHSTVAPWLWVWEKQQGEHTTCIGSYTSQDKTCRRQGEKWEWRPRITEF